MNQSNRTRLLVLLAVVSMLFTSVVSLPSADAGTDHSSGTTIEISPQSPSQPLFKCSSTWYGTYCNGTFWGAISAGRKCKYEVTVRVTALGTYSSKNLLGCGPA